MTAPTPEQMRVQATTTESLANEVAHFADRVALRRSAAAPRAAADQLEAVRPDRGLFAGMIGSHEGHDYPWKVDYILADAVPALFDADTAPRESRPAVDWERFDREVLGDD